MKGILTLSFLGFFISTTALADVGAARNSDMRRGTAAVDEAYVDEIKENKAALDRGAKEVQGEPERSVYGGQVDSKQDDQQRQEALEKIEDTPGGEAD